MKPDYYCKEREVFTMAFVKKTWKDRIAEFPTRRRLTKEDNTSELVTVAREEGTLSQEGDAFSADNMNDLENRIDAEFTEVNGKLENIFQGYKVAIFCENIPFTNGEAYYNTGFKNYKKLVVLVSNSGTTTKISATIPTESKGVIKLTATKYDGSSPTYTDTITMLVAYLE